MRKLIITVLVLSSLAILPAISFAQENVRPPIIPPDTGETILLPGATSEGSNIQQDVIGVILPSATQIIIALAGGLAFLFIIIGGIQILTAYGDDEKIGNAKKTITYAIVGLLISMLSYAIVSVISALNL